jgi:hypothetical protein
VNAVDPHRVTNCGIQGLNKVVGRLAYLWDVDPSVRWLKDTDTTTGNIVSASPWNVYDKEKPAEMMLDGHPGSWDSEADNKYAIEMFKSFITPTWTRYREAEVPIICKFGMATNLATTIEAGLNIMGTAKEYQHQGAATLMVKEFNRIADELNALVSVESDFGGMGFRLSCCRRSGKQHCESPRNEKSLKAMLKRLRISALTSLTLRCGWLISYLFYNLRARPNVLTVADGRLPLNRWLYQKNGYVSTKNPGHWVIEATSKEFAEKPKEWLFFMERARAK